MSNKNESITFRKIRGRIVPIRKKKAENSTNALALLTAAAGAGVAASGGKLESRVRVAEGRLATKIFRTKSKASGTLARIASRYKVGQQMELMSSLNNRVFKAQAKVADILTGTRRLEVLSSSLRKGRGKIKPSALILGSGLLSAGISSLLPKGKNETKDQEIARNIAAAAAGSAFAAGTGSYNLRGKLKSVLRASKILGKL